MSRASSVDGGRGSQGEGRDGRVKGAAVVPDHLKAAVHGAELRVERAEARVLEGLARLEQRVRGRRLVRGDEQGELPAGAARDLRR